MYFELDGITLFLVVLLILFVIGAVQLKRGSAEKYQYDERQSLVRGRGAKYAFFVIVVCVIIEMAFGDELERCAGREIRLFLCVISGILVDTIYVIWHDGYFPLNEYPLVIVLSLIFLLALNLFQAADMARKGMLVQDGALAAGSVYLVLAAVWLMELLTILFRYLWKKGEKEE